jgi:hypothetical protein
MHELPSLPALLVERQVVHPATAQLLAEWQRRAERDGCPHTHTCLANIVDQLRRLPNPPHLANIAAMHVIDDLVADIRQFMLVDPQTPRARSHLEMCSRRLARLTVV